MSSSSETETAVAVVKAYDFLLWLLPKAERFPRSFKFTVGDRLATAGVDMLLGLVDASYAREKVAPLEGAARSANAVRYLLRLSRDLHLMTVDAYGFASERLEEIGRMIGGWQKAARKQRCDALVTSGRELLAS
jgi:hypothetical protein